MRIGRLLVGLVIGVACKSAAIEHESTLMPGREQVRQSAPRSSQPDPKDSIAPAGTLVMHAALSCRLCPLRIFRLAGGGVAVMSSGEGLAGAAGGQATLSEFPRWEYHFTNRRQSPRSIGGRWPDELYVTVRVEGRLSVLHGLLDRRTVAWEVDTGAYYVTYAGTPAGQAFGLRVEQPSAGFGESHARHVPHRDDSGQSLEWMGTPAVVRLLGDGPNPPALPAGSVVLELEAAPAGDLFVLLRGGVVLHAAPGADVWRRLPPALARAPGEDFAVSMTVGLDGTVVVSGCARDGAGSLQRWDGASWAELPRPGDGCASVAIQGDGTTWSSVRFDERPALLRLMQKEWQVVPVQVVGIETFDPHEVMALPGALWVLGTIGDGDVEVLATTLPGGKLLELVR